MRRLEVFANPVRVQNSDRVFYLTTFFKGTTHPQIENCLAILFEIIIQDFPKFIENKNH